VDFTERYAKTLFPGIARVCGIDLPRLTLWRVEALRAIESKFLSLDGSTVITPADLTLAIRCLDCKYPNTPELRPTWHLKRWHWRMKRNKALFVAECEKFVEYLTTFSIRPELWRQEDAKAFRPISAPNGLYQIASLLEIGLTHNEAWETSPAYAQWLITTHAEKQSDKVRFVREEDSIIEHDEELTEEQILAIAKADLGDKFDEWLAARKENYHG